MERTNKVLQTDYWSTPDWVLVGIGRFLLSAEVLDKHRFDLDACANMDNTKVFDNYIDEDTDALKVDWNGTLAWCNPPYSRGNVGLFIDKAYEEYCKSGIETVFLVNVDTSTKWFESALDKAKAIVYVTGGRIKFVDEYGREGFMPSKPNMFLVIGQKKSKTLENFYISVTQLKVLANGDL